MFVEPSSGADRAVQPEDALRNQSQLADPTNKQAVASGTRRGMSVMRPSRLAVAIFDKGW
jgi:hypothetical protein